MGIMMLAKCKTCELEKQLYVGGGLGDCKMETLRNAIPQKKNWQFKAALAKMQKGGFSIDRKSAICHKCQTVCTAPVVRFMDAHGVVYREITGLCPTCEGEVEFLPDTSIQGEAVCPVCGGSLSITENGHWD